MSPKRNSAGGRSANGGARSLRQSAAGRRRLSVRGMRVWVALTANGSPLSRAWWLTRREAKRHGILEPQPAWLEWRWPLKASSKGQG